MKTEYVVRIVLTSEQEERLSDLIECLRYAGITSHLHYVAQHLVSGCGCDATAAVARAAARAATVYDLVRGRDVAKNYSSWFDIPCPKGLVSKIWAEQNAARMKTFGFNAVCAPRNSNV